MSIIQVLLAIVADLRAKNLKQLVADFIVLIQLVTSKEVPTPDRPVLESAMTSAPTQLVAPAALADEIESFCHSHSPAAGMENAVERINWAGLIGLIMKLLPLIIGGL